MRVHSVPLGVYVDNDTPIHRAPAGMKMLALFVFVLGATIAVHTVPWAATTFAAPCLGYLIARIPWRIAWQQLWPPLIFLVPLTAFQWWQLSGERALVMFLTIYAGLIAATLVTLTTQVAAMMEALERALSPLSRIGVRTDLISLTMSMTIRLIPLMLGTVNEVLDARKARGAGFSLRAFGTPIIVRSIRRARAMAEALQARGVGD